ncbi:MAG: FAD-dependent oxidoreductase [Inquilinus sp.]|nr:FAD-dependent oxidoreductase [Inquilinus sp.]
MGNAGIRGADQCSPPHRFGSSPLSRADHLSEDAVDAECDVAIVGAGFTGLRAALDLAERGCRTIVLDAKDVGWGASGRNGGQVNPMLPVERPEHLRKAVGDVYFERLAEVSLNSAEELFELVRRYGIACDARQNGWLRVDHCPAARDTARKAAKAWNAFGAGFEFVDGAELRRRTRSPAYDTGVLSAKGGAIQPLSLARGLADAARKAGARIFRNAPVSTAERTGSRWKLSTDRGQILAQSVVLATNGYTDGLIPGLARSILPVYPIQIATDALSDEEIGTILPEGHTISDTKRMIMYARRGPGNQAVFGGIGFRRPFGGLGGRRWLLQDVARIFPSLRRVAWRYFWGGRIALTADRIPHLHEPAPGVIAGLGYNGRGVAMSLVMGRVLAERLLGAGLETLPFPISPIRPFAFRGTQRAGSSLAMSWMRMRDTLEMR